MASSAISNARGKLANYQELDKARISYNKEWAIATGEGELAEPRYVPNEIIVKFEQATAELVAEQLSWRLAAEDLRLSRSLDRLNGLYNVKDVRPIFEDFNEKQNWLKKLPTKDKSQLTDTEKRILRRLRRAPREAKVPALDRLYKLTVELEPGQSLGEAVAAFDDDPAVEYAEFNHIVSILTTPNDPLYSIQWPLNNTGQSYPGGSGTEDCDIDAPEAWDISTGSSDFVVAVIDTGVDDNHRDLDDNMWTDANGCHGYDFVNDDNDPMDDAGHGTHCAGIIAAEGNNSYDISGVNWTARIMAVKFLGSGGSGTTEDAILAVEYAVDNGADILSNSWGTSDANQALQDAFNYAHSQGVISIAAAGNKTFPWEDPTQPMYPAACENVVAVAATDSDDEMASFSYHGEWVDLAAPGVDVLSLRASGTSMGSPYDDYTRVASGTSMACPHVAGACALLLSVNSAVSPNDVREILVATVDPIDDGVCYSDGRLNLYSVARAGEGKGFIGLDRDIYLCSDELEITLVDVDLKGESTQDVNVVASGGDEETVTLSVTEANGCSFTGSIQTSSDPVDTNDGTLQVSHDETITVTYYDANDGTGNPASPNDTATADCQGPVISNIQVDAPGSIATVRFETDEPATSVVRCDENCGEPYGIEGSNSSLTTSHTIKLRGFSPETDYFFIVEATDGLENQTVDNNDGDCYNFTTTSALGDINVPGDYNTIQAAVDRAWDGDTVWVADGTYTGQGNHDIDFEGRAITVRSENGADNCVIDCLMEGRAFYFHTDEDANSVVSGFTISNGRTPANASPSVDFNAHLGGGIHCVASSPTIANCNIVGCVATFWGGGLCIKDTSNEITVSNCSFSQNRAMWGGGISSRSVDDLTLENCVVANNMSAAGGGGIDIQEGTSTLKGCAIINNKTEPTIKQAGDGGGILVWSDDGFNITNSFICGNYSGQNGGGMAIRDLDYEPSLEVSMENCVISDNSGRLGGGCFLCIGSYRVTNCTFSGNSTNEEGGGIYGCNATSTILDNCILWANTAETGSSIYQAGSDLGTVAVSYSDLENGQSSVYVGGDTTLVWGPGNIDSDPNFAFEDDYHIMTDSNCIDAGTNDPCGGLPDKDIDDNNRPLDGDGDSNAVADMGAYEYNSQSPSVALSPEAFEFFCNEDGSDPNDQTLSVRNTGGATLTWQVSEDCSWLQVDPNSGTSSSEVDTVTVSIDSNGLSAGNYECELVVCDNNAVNSPRSVSVALHVHGTLRVPTDYEKIQIAINAAKDGDTVEVADGTYTGGGNRDIAFHGKAITVRSKNGPENCIIDCKASEDNPHRGFIFHKTGEDANSIVDGFTITGGCINTDYLWVDGPGSGAGIFCDESSPTIKNCVAKGNRCVVTGWPPLSWGGGIFYAGSEEHAGEFCIVSCTIGENSVEDNGAGMFVWGNLGIRSCLIIKNSSINDGGGIWCIGPMEIINCTISDNTSGGYGGGIAIDGQRNPENEPNLTNSILWGNTADNGPQIALMCDHEEKSLELSVSYSDIEGGSSDVHVGENCTLDWRSGNIDSDPCFVNPDSNDYHLVGSSSLCFNAGDPNGDYSGQVDIDGDERVMDGRVDMGADEISCMSYDHPDYDDWFEWDKPDCWCYLRQCRGDADGEKEGLYWVYDADLAILQAAWGETEENMPEGGICADFAHDIEYGVYRVLLNDLAIFQQYYEEEEPNVPECDDTYINFWVEP